MKNIIILILFFLSNNISSQNIICYREVYSNKRNFEKYCANEIKKKSECPPLPIFNIKTKKIFNIPMDIRKILFPFNEIDSVTIKTAGKLINFNEKNGINNLSNVFFNYYTFRYYNMPVSTTINCNGIIDPTIKYEILFYFKNKQIKFINYYSNNDLKSNFNNDEINLMDITEEKIEILVK